MRKHFLLLFLIAICIKGTSQEIRLLPGILFDMGYEHITSPLTNEHDYKRTAGTTQLKVGPKFDLGSRNVRLSVAGFGTYNTSENIITIFKNDYKARRTLGYGASGTIFITPWELSNSTTTLTVGDETRTTDYNNHGFSIGVGLENKGTLYKIPKESEMKNHQRFSVPYLQVGYSNFSSIGSMQLYFKYGTGKDKAGIWGIGLDASINF